MRPDTVRYFAAVESAGDDGEGDSPVARRLLRELAALGSAPEDAGVALGDGAEWLRPLFEQWFQNAVRIVGFFHAPEHLWTAARTCHRDDGAAKRWAESRASCSRPAASTTCWPRCGRPAPAPRSAARRAATCPNGAARCATTRTSRTACRSAPGALKAARKTVVGGRMKCTGMRWTIAGANPVLWVRCARLSG